MKVVTAKNNYLKGSNLLGLGIIAALSLMLCSFNTYAIEQCKGNRTYSNICFGSKNVCGKAYIHTPGTKAHSCTFKNGSCVTGKACSTNSDQEKYEAGLPSK